MKTFREQIEYIVNFPTFKTNIRPDIQAEFEKLLWNNETEMSISFTMKYFLLLSIHYEDKNELYNDYEEEERESLLGYRYNHCIQVITDKLKENPETEEENLSHLERMKNSKMVNGDEFMKYFYPFYINSFTNDQVSSFEELGVCEDGDEQGFWCSCEICDEAQLGDIYCQNWAAELRESTNSKCP